MDLPLGNISVVMSNAEAEENQTHPQWLKNVED